MNAAHLHLLVNHVPVFGLVFGLLLLVAALWRGSGELSKTSLAILVITGIGAILVYLTGEPAGESIEHMAGVGESMVERHEDAALAATIAAGVVGGLAAIALLAFRKAADLPRWVTSSALVLTLGAAGLMGWTANLGGQIRHTEIRSGAAAAGVNTQGDSGEREHE